MKTIPLTQGKFAIVDDADFDWVNQWKWCAHKNGNTWYAERGVWKDNKCVTIKMHREILKPPMGLETDHKDGKGLNNRRYNLRVATHDQNTYNKRKRKGTTSQYKGVYWNRQNAKWHAEIRVEGKLLYLGYFDSEVEAALAYDRAARKYFSEYACLNFKIAN